MKTVFILLALSVPAFPQLGYESSSAQSVPKLIENLAGKGIKQVRVCG